MCRRVMSDIERSEMSERVQLSSLNFYLRALSLEGDHQSTHPIHASLQRALRPDDKASATPRASLAGHVIVATHSELHRSLQDDRVSIPALRARGRAHAVTAPTPSITWSGA